MTIETSNFLTGFLLRTFACNTCNNSSHFYPHCKAQICT